MLFCEIHDLVWEIVSASEKRMKNCIVKIIDNVFEKNQFYNTYIHTYIIHRNFARRCHLARNAEHFYFDLTCDVTRDPDVNKICFPFTVFPGLSNAA